MGDARGLCTGGVGSTESQATRGCRYQKNRAMVGRDAQARYDSVTREADFAGRQSSNPGVRSLSTLCGAKLREAGMCTVGRHVVVHFRPEEVSRVVATAFRRSVVQAANITALAEQTSDIHHDIHDASRVITRVCELDQSDMCRVLLNRATRYQSRE